MKVLVFVLSLIATCFSAIAADKIKQTTAITPGHCIGSVQLEDDLAVVERRYGSTSFQDGAMGRFWEMWQFRHGGSLEVYCYRIDGYIHRVIQIRATSPRYSTASGLRVGSSLAEVRRAYRSLQFLPDENYDPELKRPKVTVYDAIAVGIAFEFQSNTSTAIIVHEPKSGARTDIFGGHFFYQLK